jgi:hypothetical protein
MSMNTRIATDVDYEKSGKQVGWLHLHHSVTRSAYGMIAIPVACIKNGKGPTVLFMAGNHGDEYEGQIALVKLIRELDPKQIEGRLIILPAANLPAALASARVSPLDDGNLNRSFPGDPDGGPTKQIAHYIDSVLFPMADLFHDFHSGGSSLEYIEFASVHEGPDKAVNARGLAALEAFGAPVSLVWRGGNDTRFSPAAAMKRGVPALGGEFGGGGRVSRSGVKMVEEGTRRLLVHMGMMEAKFAKKPGKSRFVAVPGPDHFVYAPEPGLFEPANDLGDTVKKGDLCGLVHFVDNPARDPVPSYFRADGVVFCKRHFGRVERGDCVAHLAVDEKR